ncbi:MAG: sigma-70 family RNA polymerase sigma factor [Candidatus Uhrbacteria bacterium]|nr:sigma-70 family RNA polymerase sigma factor [Candidatus Uhrbacteria bacterium]
MAAARRGVDRAPDGELAYIRAYADPITLEDQAVIFDLYRRYPEARQIYVNMLVQANMGLVVKTSRLASLQGRGELQNDLIAEGVIGLIRAFETYDVTKGTTFATYATYWIRQGMQRACKMRGFEGRPVYVPNSADEAYKRIALEQKLLKKQLGREPTDDEIAHELRDPRATRYNAEQARLKVTDAKKRHGMRAIPIDGPSSSDDDSRRLHEILADDSIRHPIMVMVSKETLDHCYGLLHARQLEVFQRRFGVNQTKETLEEIGVTWDLSRERIRQIEIEVIRRLREHGITVNDVKQAVAMLFPG